MRLNRIAIVVLILIAATSLVIAQETLKTPPRPAAAGTPLTTPTQKMSYAVGLNTGNIVRSYDIKLDLPALARGFADALQDARPVLSEKEFEQSIQEFEKLLREKQQQIAETLGKKNKQDGAAFLAANAKREGVKSLPSGLQYKPLIEGTGATPKLGDSVKVHYTGKQLDGTVFESSVGQDPVTFTLTNQGLIPGWVEALPMMKTGSKWLLFVPSELAYKDRGQGEIGPNATLVFEIELLGTGPAPAPAK
ncbi:MAG: FKBP-type peptidyl-prolyl cis-trans isomerase [Planctomycetota bacterium]|nr:FKBP-type peptidyl-prolyl cis-trans isomerase [Planctomycetota bacterium]